MTDIQADQPQPAAEFDPPLATGIHLDVCGQTYGIIRDGADPARAEG